MNSRMRQIVELPPRKNISGDRQEVDRIPGTTKIRTYCANASLYSKESTLEKLLKRAKLCRDRSTEN